MTTHNPVTVTAQPGVPFVDIVREFDAPVAAVYRAYSEPELVGQWLGPNRLEIDIKEYDVRPGGKWEYTHTDPAGGVYGFRGVFHSVQPEESIVQTFEFDGYPGHISLDSATFEDLGDGRSRVSIHSVFQSQEDRDGMIASGMEGGLTEGFERLDALLATASVS